MPLIDPNRPKFLRYAAALLTAMLLASSLPGDAVAQQAPDTIPAQEPVPVEDLVVTIFQVPYDRDAATSAMTVIEEEEIEASGETHVHELLRSLPGVHVAQTGSYGGTTSLFMRGGESDYVQVLVDGVPVNAPGGGFEFGTLTTTNIERIEMMHGPGSVLYGSDAMTGVLQIFTDRGEGEPRATGSVSGGTYGTLRWNANLSGGSEVADYSFAVSRFLTDGIFDFNSQYRNTVASGRVRVRPDDRTRVDLSLRHKDNFFEFPTNFAGEPVDENQVRRRESTTLGLDVSRRLGEHWRIELEGGTNELNQAFDDEPDGPADTTGFYAFQSLDDVSRRSLNGRAHYYLNSSTVFTVGGEIEEEAERSFNQSESQFGGSSSGMMDVDRSNQALYAQALTTLADRLTLNLGARVDDNDAFGTFETYRLGAAYRFDTGTKVRANYGTGFKEPSFLANFATGFVAGNPNLQPEETESWEVGVEQSLLDDRVRLGAAYFDQEFKNLIQFTFSPPGDKQYNYFNVGRAEAPGLELTADVRLVSGLSLRTNYTHLDSRVLDAGFAEGENAEFVEGDRLLRRPDHSIGATLSYRMRDRGKVRLNVNHVGSRDDRDFGEQPTERVTLDPYTLVNLSASWDLDLAAGGATLTPTLRVDNLFDTDYRQVASFPTRGRTIFVGADLSTGL